MPRTPGLRTRILPPHDCAQRRSGSPGRRAFTLVELLIVMGIIVLALTLSVPAIRALTGSRSQQGAQNTIQSFLITARTQAIGLQRVQGVMFYLDPATDRVTLAQVMQTPGDTVFFDAPGVAYLDLVPEADTLKLGAGVRARTIKDQVPYAGIKPPPYIDPLPGSTAAVGARYMGFNGTYNNAPFTYGLSKSGSTVGVPIGGVILFDGLGRLYNGPYGFRFATVTPGTNKRIFTAMGRLIYGANANSTDVTSNWPPFKSGITKNLQYLRSQSAVVTFDRETFLNQPGFTDYNAQASEDTVDAWLDANATPLFVNRYNGTLTRAE